jgi:hypothetical protein
VDDREDRILGDCQSAVPILLLVAESERGIEGGEGGREGVHEMERKS